MTITRSVARDRVLLAELENLCLRLEEAKAELRQAFAADDVRGALAAATRCESIGFLLGQTRRDFERRTSNPASRSSDALHERRHP